MQIKKLVKLLVVDDHPAFSEMLSSASEAWHPDFEIECKVVSSGSKGLAEVSDWAPNVILVDAYLPDMSCFEFLRSCQNWGTPLIVSSENSSLELQKTAMEYGARAFITKSSDPDQVEELLSRVAHIASSEEFLH